LKVTMMDAALNMQKLISRLCLCTGFVRVAYAPARQGVIATAGESVRYIQAGTRIPLLMLSK